RWDNGPVPLVIDRAALASAGLGPGSAVSLLRPRAAKARTAADVLGPLGLSVSALDAAILVTTPAEQPDRANGPWADADERAAWQTAFRQACTWGADARGRFQSATRWRSSPTPALAARFEPALRGRAVDELRTWRFG